MSYAVELMSTALAILFTKIVEESSLASGVRRIVAVTGEAALKLFQDQSELMLEIQRRLNCNEDELFDRVMQLYEDKKSLEKKLNY